MKNEVIHWFDLDGTLWNTNSMWWIVDKNNPATYLYKVSQYEGSLIMSGFYKPDGHRIYYNGLEGWLSNDVWLKLQRIKKIKLDDMGISWREYQDNNLIEKQAEEMITHIHRIKHLKGTKDIVNLLTARGNKAAHVYLIDKLHSELSTLDIKISEAYFVNDPSVMTEHGSTPEKKMMCILEKIVGHKIENEAFTPILVDKYDESHFYDDEDKNIEACQVINRYLADYLKNTQPWLKQQIIEQIHTRKPKLFLNIVNTNELNPFDTEEIEIKINI